MVTPIAAPPPRHNGIDAFEQRGRVRRFMASEAEIALREKLHRLLGLVVFGTAMVSLGLLVASVGWDHPRDRFPMLQWAARVTLTVFAVAQFSRLATAPSHAKWLRHRWPGLALAGLALVEAIGYGELLEFLQTVFPAMPVQVSMLALLAASQAPVLIAFGLRFIRIQDFFAERRVSPGAVLMITFAALIVSGTLLLKMPRATVDGLSWLDAFFTATSAVCVTGLVVVDTETAFTPTGHAILLLLIQLGGLGVMTLTTFLAYLFGGVSLRGRVLVQDLISEENVGRIGRTLPLIIAITFTFEAAGACALYASFDAEMTERGGRVFSAVFHSVSAFCNAGFSNWSGGLHDPLVRGNTAVQCIVMILVVAGGLGFPVLFATGAWFGARAHRLVEPKGRRQRLAVHARLAWWTTAVLIALGAVVIGASEFLVANQPHDTPAVVAALFHSITARTAGFNIAPVEMMTPAAVSMWILLMFIGGCPGGTAGGIKTTAFVVALLNVRRIVLGHRDVEAFGRRLPEETVSRALAVLFLSIAWIGAASTLLAVLEPHVPLSAVVFETVSALSTVGLTRGITPELGAAGKLLITLTMFAGRIGVLYFVLAFLRRPAKAPYRLPEETIYVN